MSPVTIWKANNTAYLVCSFCYKILLKVTLNNIISSAQPLISVTQLYFHGKSALRIMGSSQAIKWSREFPLRGFFIT